MLVSRAPWTFPRNPRTNEFNHNRFSIRRLFNDSGINYRQDRIRETVGNARVWRITALMECNMLEGGLELT